MKEYRKVLTIAGSDSGGGAGIQADLKTFSACGCFGMSAVTAITAQNTCGVTDIHAIPASSIAAQIHAVLDDIGADAIKIGMLHSSEVILTVTEVLHRYGCKNIIVDPVMVATSGDRLIEEDAVATLKENLLPMASLITPNIPEAEILAGEKISGTEDMAMAAEKLGKLFGTSVLAKGGHLTEDLLVDILWSKQRQKTERFENRRVATRNSHGTGCTLSSAIASFAAYGNTIEKSVALAEEYLHSAIAAGAEYRIGKGHGPVHHFHSLWSRQQNKGI